MTEYQEIHIVCGYVYYRFKEEGNDPKKDKNAYAKTLYMMMATIAKNMKIEHRHVLTILIILEKSWLM